MKKKLTPLKAIRAKCLECSGGSPKEVRFCPAEDCSLFPFRLGKNPHRKGIGSTQGLTVQKSRLESEKISKNEDLNDQPESL